MPATEHVKPVLVLGESDALALGGPAAAHALLDDVFPDSTVLMVTDCCAPLATPPATVPVHAGGHDFELGTLSQSCAVLKLIHKP